MTEETARAQDVGRRHRRRAAPSAETRTLLARWHGALRVELEAVIVELEGAPPATGILPPAQGEKLERVRPSLEKRRQLVELGAKIATALGSEISTPAPDEAPPAPRSRSRRRPEFG